MDLPRPTTPNTVLYDNETGPPLPTKANGSRSMASLRGPPGPPPGPPMYLTPRDTAAGEVASLGGGAKPTIWTVEGDNLMSNDDKLKDEDEDELDEDEETRILLEKEFDDFYEDQVHKSAGPVVFVSKMLGMLPAIWTDDDTESDNECKSYFNLYTFLIFAGWIALAVMSAMQIGKVETWPGNKPLLGANATSPMRFVSRSTIDTYFACTWAAGLVALLFGVFKCRSMADILFGLSETDAQLELKEKHYDKLKRKTCYWILVLALLLVGHSVAFSFLVRDAFDMIDNSMATDFLLIMADVAAHMLIFTLDLQFLHMAMVLCKRYRVVNKLLLHVSRPWKTFRDNQPPNYMLQNILQYSFDQIWAPDSNLQSTNKMDCLTKKKVPLDMLIKGGPAEEQKISKEEENTFILQLDILRGIHADLNAITQEVNKLVGFQFLVHLITGTVMMVMFGYFFIATTSDQVFYWPFLVLCLLPALEIAFLGHWGEHLKQQSRQPFMTICQVSSVEGSPRLERQVHKVTVQMHHQCPNFSTAGYFHIDRQMIIKLIGLAIAFAFFMVKFDKVASAMTAAITANTAAAATAAATAATSG